MFQSARTWCMGFRLSLQGHTRIDPQFVFGGMKEGKNTEVISQISIKQAEGNVCAHTKKLTSKYYSLIFVFLPL